MQGHALKRCRMCGGTGLVRIKRAGAGKSRPRPCPSCNGGKGYATK